MAKNWTMAEAAVAINSRDKEALLDIGKRFPLATSVIERALLGDRDAVVELITALPDYNTMNKFNTAIKAGIDESADVETSDDVEENDEAPVEKKSTKPAAKKEVEEDAEATDYEKMGAYPLYKLCKERGLDVKSKQPKETYIAALVAADGGASDEAEEDEAEEATGYEAMSAQELFKECKKRGIKVEAKKKPKYYIDLLEADDNKAGDADTDDDDWDDDEPEEKPAKKESSKKSAKPAKDEDDDDDDDWDI